jgi:hypothetical protein
MAKKKILNSPEELSKKIDSYFDFKKTDFAYKFDVVKSGIEAGKELQIKVSKPMHVVELAVYLGITSATFNRYYKLYKEREEEITTALIGSSNDSDVLSVENQCLLHLARAYDRIMSHIVTGGMNGTIDAGIAKTLAGIQDTININSHVTVNALPINIGTKAIDLTEFEYQVLENE